jgi:cytochrome P450
MTGTFNPLAEGYFDDPYAQYGWMREHEPIHRSPFGVMCFTYDDVSQLLRQPGLSMTDAGIPNADGSLRPRPPVFPHGLINLDPPAHPRVRRVMSKIFTPRKMEALASTIADDVAERLDAIEAQSLESGAPVDLVAELAFPLPFKVISDILGMPEDAQGDQVRAWAQAVTEASLSAGRGQMKRALDAYQAICRYVTDEVIPWKRRHPADDLLTILIAAHDDDGETMSAEVLLDQVTLLYVAGHETTSGLIGNGVLNLLRHRDQLELLRDDPELIGSAVEELNRYDSSIQFTWRYPVDALTLGDIEVAAGEMILLGLGSANRDPLRFGPDAGTVDIRRADARDAVSFGAGPHFCLGAALARQEGALAIGALIARFPELELAGDATWNPRVTFRALQTLPVTLGPSGH